MKVADIDHVESVRSQEEIALRVYTVGENEFRELCATARRGADDAVEPMVKQLEYLSDEMRKTLHGSPLNKAVMIGHDELLRWQTLVELVRRALDGETTGGQRCRRGEHWSIPGLDRCHCGGFDLANGPQRVGSSGRPILFAAIATFDGRESRLKFGDGDEMIAVELPPNCSINIDVDLNRGDAPAPPFISVRNREGVLELNEVER